MKSTRAGHVADEWIIQNPWLRDAFRDQPVPADRSAVAAASAATSLPAPAMASLVPASSDAAGADAAASRS